MDKAELGTSKTAKSENFKTAAESLTIPKHRFDCVNLCLKETKQALREKNLETSRYLAKIAGLEKALLEAKVDTALAQHRAKSLTAVRALIDISNLRLEHDGTVPGLEEQVLNIKNSQSYLFENQQSQMYVLMPVKSGEGLEKSIASYINTSRRAEK